MYFAYMGNTAYKSYISDLDVLYKRLSNERKNSDFAGARNIKGNPHGQGTLITSTGDKISGTWKDGVIDSGNIEYAKGGQYQGDIAIFKRHGNGIMEFADKAVYEGTWEDDSFNGRGKMKYANGNICEGNWMQGKFNGTGKMIYANGEIYEGIWKDNLRNGVGTKTCKNAFQIQEEWKNGKLVNSRNELLIPYRNKYKWGFCTKNKKIFIECIYDDVGLFYDGLAFVVRNNKVGYINISGEEIIKCNFDLIQNYDFHEYYEVEDCEGHNFREGNTIVKKNNQFGFIDKTGKEILPIKYDKVGRFSEGLARVETGGKFGFINTQGIFQIGIKYTVSNVGTQRDCLGIFQEGLAKVLLNDEYFFIDMLGNKKLSLKKYSETHLYSEGLAAVRKKNDNDYHNDWGYIDKTGKEVISLQYEDANDFHEGLAIVEPQRGHLIAIDKDGNVCIDRNSPVMGGCCENMIAELEENVRGRHGGLLGFLNKNGKLVIPYTYNNAHCFQEGLAAVQLSHSNNDTDVEIGEWGFIDKAGKEIIPFIYDEVMADFKSGIAKVKFNNKVGYIDNAGTQFWED